MAEPTLTPREKAITHVNALYKDPAVASLSGQPGFNIFGVLTPTLTALVGGAAVKDTPDEQAKENARFDKVVADALKLDNKPETYKIKLPIQATQNSISPMVQAAVEGAGPVKPLASSLNK